MAKKKAKKAKKVKAPKRTAKKAKAPKKANVKKAKAPKKAKAMKTKAAAPEPKRVLIQKKGLAVAGLVLGIFSLVPIITAYQMVVGLLAMIFSITALKKIKRAPAVYGGKGMAIWGLVLGIIGLLAGVVFLIVLLVNNNALGMSLLL